MEAAQNTQRQQISSSLQEQYILSWLFAQIYDNWIHYDFNFVMANFRTITECYVRPFSRK